MIPLRLAAVVLLPFLDMFFGGGIRLVEARLGSQRILQAEPLTVAGNNGNPPNRFPLQNCEGDCDNDRECDEGLICLQRGSGDPVPGCFGDLTGQMDYCVLITEAPTSTPTSPPSSIPTSSPTTTEPTFNPTTAETTSAPTESPTTQEPTYSPTKAPTTPIPTSGPSATPTITVPETVTITPTPTEAMTLGDTMALTAREALEVSGIAMESSATEAVTTVAPTVATTTPTEAEDVLTQVVTTIAPTVAPSTMEPTTAVTEVVTTIMPTTDVAVVDEVTVVPTAEGSPSAAPAGTDDSLTVTVAGVLPDETYPLLTVGNDGNFPSYPLQLCHGDCDVDKDCVGDLVCMQRIMDEPVPGCYGQGDFSIDYCIQPLTLLNAFEEPQGVAAGGAVELVPVDTPAPSVAETLGHTTADSTMDPTTLAPSAAETMPDTSADSTMDPTTLIDVVASIFEEGTSDPTTVAPSAAGTEAETLATTVAESAAPTTWTVASIFEAPLVGGVAAGGATFTGSGSSSDGVGDKGDKTGNRD